MADNLPTIWDKAAHTVAKHKILETYLNAWMAIMSRQSMRVGAASAELLFVDGFAGPGCYSGGEVGSPILAIKSVLHHSQKIPIPVSFLFIEEDPERHNILQAKVGELKDETRNSPRIKTVDVLQGNCEARLRNYLVERKQKRGQIGPAFFYLDQFGYSDISIELLGAIMAKPMCEVFLYLNWDHMNRFLSDKTKWPSITRTYGGEEWKPALSLELCQRAPFMLKTYSEALKGRARSRYVWQFAMCDGADKLLYWLFFCTNSLRGLEEMKKAMWKVDPSGGFRFSDKDDPSQFHLFTTCTEESLAHELASHFRGKTSSVEEIKEFVLSETPAHLFKGSLKLLERKGVLTPADPQPGRRKGTFPNNQMRVHFRDTPAN